MPDIISIPDITLLYACLFGIFGAVLAFFAGKMRGETGILLGDGNNEDLILAMRRQANFIEYVPMMLIILGLMEMNGAPDYAIHGIGIALLVARGLHAWGIRKDKTNMWARAVGAAGTALVTLVASLWGIYLFIS